MTDFSVVRVSNGFIVYLDWQTSRDTLQSREDIYVFETIEALNQWIADRYTKEQ